ncbi:cysteine hydrolase family protein [Carnobacterium gallinarum]|uniref:cysteine hydrolase family protein n=1 Tax=Carnobacterium gallinarum TaxID=2749 RepID=UPI0005576CFD|nr:cysteine hydrolase family protein [Carnobacterium gallinarum]
MKQALLVIDVQNDYFTGGRMALIQPEKALKNINRLEHKFQQENCPIVYIQHVNRSESAAFFQANTEGVELHSDLLIREDSLIIEKQFPNSFFKTNLKSTLDKLNVDQLVITGMMTHMCVDSTTRAAKELGFQPIVLTDATATLDLEYNGQFVKADDVKTAFSASFKFFAEVTTTLDYADSNIKLDN